MSKSWQISRRTMLRGAGAAVALPMLNAMVPSVALAASAGKPPVRMAYLFIPNGVHMPDWKPKSPGEMPKTLAHLESVKKDVTVISNLEHRKAFANGDGPGDHARSAGTFLTGKQCLKSGGVRAGVSADQVAAVKIGDQTYLSSLELGIDRGRTSGNCDSGYSCAYSSNISWRNESTPMAKEINPRQVLERMFKGRRPSIPRWDQTAARKAAAVKKTAKSDTYKTSVIDLVREDAKSLRSGLGAADQRKLDEYIDSLRSLEKRIAFASRQQTRVAPTTKSKYPRAKLNKVMISEEGKGVPGNYEEHVKLMLDLIILAFQTDTTRIATFMFANEGSNRSYPDVGVTGGHHSLSHHGGDGAKQAQIQKINEVHIKQFAYMLEKMKNLPELDRSLLDNSMICYGSAISDGNRHNHDDLPVLLAGRGGGTLKPGRHVTAPKKTPMCNLYLEMLRRVGAPTKQFGDSTGGVPGLV
jgi:hypothetical protein